MKKTNLFAIAIAMALFLGISLSGQAQNVLGKEIIELHGIYQSHDNQYAYFLLEETGTVEPATIIGDRSILKNGENPWAGKIVKVWWEKIKTKGSEITYRCYVKTVEEKL